MRIDHKFEYCNGLYFYHSFDKNEWSPEWLHQLSLVIPQSFEIVKNYTSITEFPEIFLISKTYSNRLRQRLHLPNWVVAISFKSNIYIFFNHETKNWQEVINHEMFHIGVYQTVQCVKTVPKWFNEAVAYYIGQ